MEPQRNKVFQGACPRQSGKHVPYRFPPRHQQVRAIERIAEFERAWNAERLVDGGDDLDRNDGLVGILGHEQRVLPLAQQAAEATGGGPPTPSVEMYGKETNGTVSRSGGRSSAVTAPIAG